MYRKCHLEVIPYVTVDGVMSCRAQQREAGLPYNLKPAPMTVPREGLHGAPLSMGDPGLLSLLVMKI